MVRGLARESGRHGMKKIGLPRPLHRLLCLRSRIGGNRDWLVCAHAGDGVIKTHLALLFLVKYPCEANFKERVHPVPSLNTLLYLVVILRV